MRLLSTAVAIALALNGTLVAQQPQDSQDPTKTLPRSYKLDFENDWVRIVRVHYDAKAKLPEHEHPAGITVYLYLNASDGVLFQHNQDEEAVRRPAVQPGAIRVSTTPMEHHTVTNQAGSPSDFLRILLKTDPGRTGPPNSRMSPSVMEYEHARVRVSRINVQPGTKTRIEAKNYPVLRVAWAPNTTEYKLAAKDAYRFLDKGTTEEFEVTGNVPLQLVTIELRTSLVKPR
jgi:hypothetical protein